MHRKLFLFILNRLVFNIVTEETTGGIFETWHSITESDSTKNRSFRRRSSKPISWLATEKLSHTHTHARALFRDYPGEPVPER